MAECSILPDRAEVSKRVHPIICTCGFPPHSGAGRWNAVDEMDVDEICHEEKDGACCFAVRIWQDSPRDSLLLPESKGLQRPTRLHISDLPYLNARSTLSPSFNLMQVILLTCIEPLG